jgi:2,3-bisphosphoglycerate-independent phosphoglycerate mutase
VPLILTDTGFELAEGGELSYLVPTMLYLLGIDKPAEMTGKSLIRSG